MSNAEFRKWLYENLVKGETIPEKGIYNYTLGDYSFTTKPTKSGHLSLYANGKVCATRIYDNDFAVYDSIYVYLYKKMGITKD